MKKVLSSSVVLAVLLFSAAPEYKLATKINIGGDVRWDDLYIDGANHRGYFSHTSQVEVVDTADDKLAGTIPDTPGVH